MPKRTRRHRQSRRTAGAHVQPSYLDGMNRMCSAYGIGKSIAWEAAIYSFLRRTPEEVEDAIRWVGAIDAIGEAEEAVESAMEPHETEPEDESES